jgi:hypothetical protein
MAISGFAVASALCFIPPNATFATAFFITPKKEAYSHQILDMMSHNHFHQTNLIKI